MGLRPKTVRRLMLAGALGVILIVGGVVALTLPKLQRARQIEAFGQDGLAAHEAGDHSEAINMLKRHVRVVGEEIAEPELLLALARSRAMRDSPLGEHHDETISFYRAYLRRVPDDLQARRELLGSLVKAGRYPEAVELAERINPADSGETESLASLRDELTARAGINSDDPRIPALEAALLGVETPAFGDVLGAMRRVSRSGGDISRAAALARDYIEKQPDAIGARVLGLVTGVSTDGRIQRPDQIASSIAELLDLDGDLATQGSVRIDEPGLGEYIAVLFDGWGLGFRSVEVLAITLQGEDAYLRANELARRLYWLGQDRALIAIDVSALDAARVCDTIGYQALAAWRIGETDTLARLREQLEGMRSRYQALGWLAMLEASELSAQDDWVGARASIGRAIEQHPFEPTFHLFQGDIQNELGFHLGAINAWDLAEQYALSQSWTTPLIRRATTQIETGREIEAFESLRAACEPGSPTSSDLDVWNLTIRLAGNLVRTGMLQSRVGEQLAVDAELVRASLPDELRSAIDLPLGSLYAALGRRDDAVAALARVIESGATPAMLGEVQGIDRLYRLGVMSASAGLPSEATTPGDVYQRALVYTQDALGATGVRTDANEAELDSRIEQAVALFDAGAGVSDADRAEWLGAKARYLDEFLRADAQRARVQDAWRAALDAGPDRLELWQGAVTSRAFQTDRAFVESGIERVRELTGSQGRSLPNDLRLARALAIFGDAPVKQARDEAISVVRAVVGAEPRNIRARRILSRMLSAECSPVHTAASDRFEPNVQAAIAELETIVAQVRGPASVGYQLEIIGLAQRVGDADRARRAAMDALAFVGSDASAMSELARAIREAGDPEGAARVLAGVFASSQGETRVRSGLALAETYAVLRDRARVREVLVELAGVEILDALAFEEIASRMMQFGLREQAEAMLENAQGYGLTPSQGDAVRAALIARFEPADVAVARLSQLTEHPDATLELWTTLVRLLIESGETDAAIARLDAADSVFPESQALAFLRARASNDTARLAQLALGEDAPGSDALRAALADVEGFERRRVDLTSEQQLEQLREIGRRYPALRAVQNFVIVERELLGEGVGTLAPDAIRSAERFRTEPLLGVAVRGSLASGDARRAMSLAAVWRGVTTGSTLEPDLYAAEARQVLGEDDRVVAILDPYLDDALADPANPLHLGLMRIHGGSALRLGRGEEVESRYRPLAMNDAEFRQRVWIPLASSWVGDPERAGSWLELAERAGGSDERASIVQGWLDAARTHEVARGVFLALALESVDAGLGDNPDDAGLFVLRAVTLRLLAVAEGGGEPGGSSERMSAAAEAFIVASRANPDDPGLLFQAARCAEDAYDYALAESLYGQLIAHPRSTGFIGAVALNNRAMVALRQGVDDPGRLGQLLADMESALGVQAAPAFFGTRGWIRLVAGQHAEAESDFRRCTREAPGIASAHAGLAIAISRTSGAVTDPARQAWSQALSLGLNDPFVLGIGESAGFASE